MTIAFLPNICVSCPTDREPHQQQGAPGLPPPVPPPPVTADYYKPKESHPGEEISPLVKPMEGGLWAQVSWGITVPIHAFCRATIPDCKKERWRHWYPFTFLMSMIWISFYSYIMVWMITVIGKKVCQLWACFCCASQSHQSCCFCQGNQD
jgi:hypothetical protein